MPEQCKNLPTSTSAGQIAGCYKEQGKGFLDRGHVPRIRSSGRSVIRDSGLAWRIFSWVSWETRSIATLASPSATINQHSMPSVPLLHLIYFPFFGSSGPQASSFRLDHGSSDLMFLAKYLRRSRPPLLSELTPSTSGIVLDPNTGDRKVAPSKRPDGTWAWSSAIYWMRGYVLTQITLSPSFYMIMYGDFFVWKKGLGKKLRFDPDSHLKRTFPSSARPVRVNLNRRNCPKEVLWDWSDLR